jgi:phospholipid/cholesterol/gamma-HCH transport system substrate-binding protein
MNNAQTSARVGLFFLLGIALIWVTHQSLSGNKTDIKNGYELVARFTTLKELKSGDEVRMAGGRIGQVRATRLAGRRAEAVLLIDGKVQVARDATATIAMAGLLGSNYISVTLGTEAAGFLEPGSEMRAVDTADLNSIVAQLGDVGEKVEAALSSFSGAMGGEGGAGGGGLLAKLDLLIDENREKVGAITANLEDITGKIRRGEGTVGKLVHDEQAYTNLVATLDEIRGAAEQARTFVSNAQGIVDQVKSGEGTLGALLYDQETGTNIKLVSQNLRELSEKLNKGEGTLGRLINDDSLFREAQNAVQKVNRAVDGMADQGPITAVGVAANALF